MQSYGEHQLLLAHARRAQQFREAREYRQVSEARRSARPPQSFRRAVGQSLVRAGERLAGEPHLEPARSR